MKFFIHFLKNLKETGAVAPSSKFLTRNLVKSLQQRLTGSSCGSLNILEVGPGTGSITKAIHNILRPEDKFDVVEVQEEFYNVINRRYNQENMGVYHTDILNFAPDVKYDFIFSSLPYENMDDKISNRIWNKKLSLCTSNGYISYFKYLSFRKFKNDYEEKVVNKYMCDKKVVLRNLPPAKLYTLQVDKQTTSFAEAV